MTSGTHALEQGKPSDPSSELGPLRFSPLEWLYGGLRRGEFGSCTTCSKPIARDFPRAGARAVRDRGELAAGDLEFRLEFRLELKSTHGGEWRDAFCPYVRAPRDELRAAVLFLFGALQADHALAVVTRWCASARVHLLEHVVSSGLGKFSCAPSSDVMHLVLESASHAMCGGRFPSQVLIPSPSVGMRCERCSSRLWAMVKGDAAMRLVLASLARGEGTQILGRCTKCQERGK